jgi:DNA-binding CsgD family transcriptional regulator
MAGLLRRELPLLGFTLYLLAYVFLEWPAAFGLHFQAYAPQSVSEAWQQAHVPVYCTVFACWSLYAWLRPAAKRLFFSVSYAAASVSGSLMLFVAMSLDDPGIAYALALPAGAVAGFGQASLFMTWARVFSVREFQYSSNRIVLSCMGAIGSYIVLVMLPAAALAALLLLLVTPLASALAVACIAVSDFSTPAFNHMPSKSPGLYLTQARKLWRPAMYTFGSASVWGLTRALAMRSPEISHLTDVFSILGFFLAAVALLLTWRTLNNRFGFIKSYRAVTPLYLICILLLPLCGDLYLCIFMAISTFMFLYAFIMMFQILCRDASLRGVHPMIAWGAFATLCAVAFDCVGYLLGDMLTEWLAMTAHIGQGTIAALLCMFLFSIILFIDHRPKRSAVGSAESPLSLSCRELAKRYSLSQREYEICCLLGRGRSVEVIASSLLVSQSTVQFHCKNIYRKLDIHSKQELLDIIDGI